MTCPQGGEWLREPAGGGPSSLCPVPAPAPRPGETVLESQGSKAWGERGRAAPLCRVSLAPGTASCRPLGGRGGKDPWVSPGPGVGAAHQPFPRGCFQSQGSICDAPTLGEVTGDQGQPPASREAREFCGWFGKMPAFSGGT